MGHVQDRWFTATIDQDSGKIIRRRTNLYGKGDRYKARYLDPDGRERSKTFPDRCKGQAEDFLTYIESQIRTGVYVDPVAGKRKFRMQAENWLKSQSTDRATRIALESRLNSRIYPYLGNRSLKSIKPSVIRDWLGELDESSYSQNYRTVLFTIVSSVLDSAVEDRLIESNPCKVKSIKRPISPRNNIVVWPEERFFAVREGLADRFRILATIGGGCGLRQGELLAVSPQDRDVDSNTLHIRRQLRMIDRQLVFALPKGGKVRRVPLPATVDAAITSHLDNYPAVPVTLPWNEPDGEPITVPLLATGENKRLYSGDLFNKTIWRSAFRTKGLDYRKRIDGMHALRHFYASVLLAQGVSIKELSEYLGHSDPGFTLRTYTHLVPSSFQRARIAIDGILRPRPTPDGLYAA